ncbi:MAG: putative repeat protein (TIGR01451 family) [Halioglobus sp.]|jgi:uncharacterized repeat protein (TIGR01451 family)
MKNLLLLATLFCYSYASFSQITSIDFILDYDTDDGTTYYYNANLLINSGSATTIPQRVQFNSQYSIVMPTGAEVEIDENYMPLFNNANYGGTEPIDWEINFITISPNITPDKDYVSITPKINISTYHYNNLAAGDIIPLFRIAVSNGVGCPNDVRLFENGVDPSSSEIGNGYDYSNGFTVGSTSQLYSGNQPSNISITDISINDNEVINCAGECVIITPDVVCAPLDLTYLWSTGETTESITVCPNVFETYTVTVTGSPGLTAVASIFVNIEEDVIYFDNEVEFFCIGQSYFPNSEFGLDTWASSDESVASFDNDELLIHAEGTTNISTTTLSGCVTEYEITTSPLPIVAFDGPSTICGMQTTNMASSSTGAWTTDNTSIATVTNAGNVTAISPGITYLTFTNNTNLCQATTDIPLTVLPAPFIQNTGSEELCIGETTLMASANAGTWESFPEFVATIDNSGLITAVSSGEAYFTFTETQTGCTNTLGTIIVNPSPEITSGAPKICVGEKTNLFPSTGGTWTSDDPSVATINNNGLATGVSPGIVRFSFTDATTGCTSAPSNTTIVESCMANPALECSQAEIICDMDLLNNFLGTMPQEESGGNQPNPLCPDNTGVANNISWIGFVAPEGNYSITVTPINCSVSTDGTEGVQIGLYTSCDFTESVFCDANCSTDPVTFDSSVLESGQEYFLFIDGCSGSACEYEIQLTGSYISQCESPCDDASINTAWDYVPAGEFNEDYNIITYATAPNLLETGGRDHLVFYDYNTGNVYLKENNGNGFLDNEILLFNNEDHYENGTYKIYLEDIDNDGLTDLVLSESSIFNSAGSGDRLSVYQNLGSGEFVLQINEQVCGMEGPDKLTIVDFDNDGMKDIFFVCVDYIYDILWINSWENIELNNFNAQNFEYFYTGDFNDDGNIDIAFDDCSALLNNGDRTFEESNFVCPENITPSLYYFVEESSILIDHFFLISVEGTQSSDWEYCGNFQGGDYENEIFRAFINSPIEESIIIPQVEGFQSTNPNIECLGEIELLQTSNVVARQNTKIDLTLNGCTDFLVIEGDQIFAWINPKQSTKILGTAFIDKNANGVYDSDELPLRNVLVSITPGDFSILTDDDGNYTFSVPPGTYTLTANVNEGEWVQTELTIDNIQITEPCNEGYNFPFVPIPTPEEMATLSMVNTIARCDFETRFTITVENTGAEPLDAVLTFNFDDKTTFFSSDIAGYQLIGNTVSANIGPLAPFSPQTYKVTVKMPSGSTNLPMLAFDAKLYDKFGDLIKEYGYSDQLRCSYDPNDKREYPDREGLENLTLMDEDLEYTIRFQNNGNDTAFQVKIVDPLDSNIDPSTIRVINASHDVETCIEGTDLIFLFEDILLVDSTTNYAASQGFVTFRCNAKDGRAEMTPVHNQADIIFDTNSPIVTNKTINTLVSELCTDKETFLSAAICDGESYEGYTESGIYTQNIELPYGCDSLVTIELDVQGITIAQNTVDICQGESIFFNGVSYDIAESTEIVDTILNENGCIKEVISLQVNVTQINYSQEDITACEGDDIVINGNTYLLTESIEVIDSFFGLNGCVTDIQTFQIMVLPTIYEQLDTTICEGFDYEGLTVAGTYTIDSFDLATGCQLKFTINLAVLPSSDPLCIVGTKNLAENLVKLYPNPASESIFIETKDVWELIKIVNTQGKTVTDVKQDKAEKQEIIISQYPSGVYMIIFQDGKKNLTKRFVVR